MELALIPPNQFLETTGRTNTQLVLPHELQSNKEYEDYYVTLMDDPNHFVIMDNGAAESAAVSNDTLYNMAMTYAPSELAVPDVLADSKASMLQSNIFLDKYGDALIQEGIRLGIVAQGITVDEVVWSCKQIMSFWEQFAVTIYLPRLLVNVTRDPDARFKVMDQLGQRYFDSFAFHFFGASYYPDELRRAALDGRVRSFDTSLPYNFGYGDLVLDDRDMSQLHEIHRPVGYFTQEWTPTAEQATMSNIETCIRMANGE